MLRFYKAIRPGPGFYVDEAPNTSPLTVELFAQVRSIGRILDNYRHVLRGSILLEGGFPISKICRREDMTGWTANFTVPTEEHHPEEGDVVQPVDGHLGDGGRQEHGHHGQHRRLHLSCGLPEELWRPGGGADSRSCPLGSHADGVRSAYPPAAGTSGRSRYLEQQACFQEVSL
jgi:hypothetical protein